MVGENTHLSGLGGDVDLNTIWERFVSMGRSKVKDGRAMLSTYSDCEATYTPADLKMDCWKNELSVSNIHAGAQRRSTESEAYLVRKGQGKLDLVRHSLGVTSALERNAESGGTSPEGRASEAERAHLAMDEGGGW